MLRCATPHPQKSILRVIKVNSGMGNHARINSKPFCKGTRFGVQNHTLTKHASVQKVGRYAKSYQIEAFAPMRKIASSRRMLQHDGSVQNHRSREWSCTIAQGQRMSLHKLHSHGLRLCKFARAFGAIREESYRTTTLANKSKKGNLLLQKRGHAPGLQENKEKQKRRSPNGPEAAQGHQGAALKEQDEHPHQTDPEHQLLESSHPPTHQQLFQEKQSLADRGFPREKW